MNIGLHTLNDNSVALNYFNWMIEKVTDNSLYKTRGSSHYKLLNKLHETPFSFTLIMDGNRFEDGVSLRYDYGEISYTPPKEIAAFIDNRDCSVLEMMVALASRMTDLIGPITPSNNMPKWFWLMIDNMRLGSMSDNLYSEMYVETRLDIMLERKYDYNGHGGLFVVNNPSYDMRNAEIRYQMNWYINENIML